jgi:hypothetical protein
VKSKSKGKRITLYVADGERFKKLNLDAIIKWYQTFGEYPTQSQIIDKALTNLINALSSGENKEDVRRNSEYINIQ